MNMALKGPVSGPGVLHRSYFILLGKTKCNSGIFKECFMMINHLKYYGFVDSRKPFSCVEERW